MALAITPAAAAAGWKTSEASILLFDSSGSLTKELGVGTWEKETRKGIIEKRTMRGGVSSNGRFAWHWEKTETYKTSPLNTLIASTRTLVYLGTNGQALWETSLADAPEGIAPLLQSDDGETFLVIETSSSGWSPSAYTYTGNKTLSLPTSLRLERLTLTKNGRYALQLWGQKDDTLTYTFFKLENGQQKEILAMETPLGYAEIDETGRIHSGKKTIYHFQ